MFTTLQRLCINLSRHRFSFYACSLNNSAPFKVSMSMPRQERLKTIAVLVVCQALLMASGSILLSFNSLVGIALAPEPRLATLPHALLNVVNAAIVTPASLFMLRVGRRNGFVLGALSGVLSGVL